MDRAHLRALYRKVNALLATGACVRASDACIPGAAPVAVRRVFLGHAPAILCNSTKGQVFWATEFFDAEGRRID